jgi:hypothetical protein
MVMRFAAALLALVALVPSAAFADPADDAVQADAADTPSSLAQHHKHHHKHHHHKHHHHHHHDAEDKKDQKVKAAASAAPAKKVDHPPSAVLKRVSHAKPSPATPKTSSKTTGKSLSAKMKSLETKLHAEEKKEQGEQVVRKSLKVNGPLPANFEQQFSQAVAKATHSDASKVKVVSELPGEAGIVQVFFTAPKKVADEAEDEAGDPDSPLATGALQSFLTAKGDDDASAPEPAAESVTVASQDTGKSLDINAAMPYGDLEPFGREDTGQELTEDSISESNEMVDQLERAEVAEEKRAVFRALTRLRGAAITSFDGIARSQTGNIDEYNKVNKWRKTHPLHHLADEESDVSRWAFPDIADF